MKFKPCSKCGSTHSNPNRQPFSAKGKWWCGHCGTKLEKQ